MNQTEYWLEGKFNELYKDIIDPWGCVAGGDSIYNNMFMNLIDKYYYKSVLEIGCGLGAFISKFNVLIKKLYGVDISEVAIGKAKLNYPMIQFEVKDVINDEFENMGKFDLIVINEVIWYLAKDINTVLIKIQKLLNDNGIVAIKQYFPYDQKYYTECIQGHEGFEKIVQQYFIIDQNVKSIFKDEGIVQNLILRSLQCDQ
jgi:SAM-dependent methyltransferase